MDEFNIINELNKIIKRIQEEEDNTIKAFAMYIGGLLIKNGIKPILTKVEMPYEEYFNKIEYQIVSRYGYMFERLDTAEHDKQIRDEVRKYINLQILDIRATLHDIQRMDMPKELFDRLNYELDKKLYELQEQMKGEQNE